MATDTVPNLRLQALERLCSDIATGLNGARRVLRDNAEDASVAHLVADVLDRLGWMADRAAALSGSDIPAVVGGADEWMMDPVMRELLVKIEGSASCTA